MTLLNCIFLTLLALSGLAMLNLEQKWTQRAEIQLRLDRCVGSRALALKSLVVSLENTNYGITALRASLAAANLAPAARPPLEAALQALVVGQNLSLLMWRGQNSTWISGTLCGKKGDHGWPLPWLAFQRDPPDSIGPKVLNLNENGKTSWSIRMQHGRLSSQAWTWKRGRDHEWKAKWSATDPDSGAGHR